MEKHYKEKIEARQREKREMRNRQMRQGIAQYGENPYRGSVIKLGNYNDIQAAQKECNERIREVLKQMSSLSEKVGSLVETQKRIQEALEINKSQNHVDGYKAKGREEDEGEER